MAKKKTTKKKTTKKTSRSASSTSESADGKKLVIVESPAKARTINKYLGTDYVVKASVGHVRDLPSRNPKGVKNPVPGVDLEHKFKPTYEVLTGKTKTISELKKLAKQADEIWFATDLDREGEAIAWHLAQVLGIHEADAKRVVFNAITKEEISRAFDSPRKIDMNRVDAQQARRVLDRIVGYQVSPLLWKKVARGLSAGRVQSVAVRLVVEREREILAHVPDESWKLTARFALKLGQADKLANEWASFITTLDEKKNTPTLKVQNAWLAEHAGLKAELVSVGGEAFDVSQPGSVDGEVKDLSVEISRIAGLAGLKGIETLVDENPDGKGPARYRMSITGEVDTGTPYAVKSIETKRTTSRPSAPFITSTLQQAASTRLSFGAQRTMRTAQSLYEGVTIKGEGAVGLITYMRTDSTHLSGEAMESARHYIDGRFGKDYLPDKPNFYASSNKAAQEAHEAIRPTNVQYSPEQVKSALKPDEFKLYKLIWDRFVSCQMTPAKWDATTVLVSGGTDPATPVVFKATGRALAFDGFYRVSGVPTASDEQTLPQLEEAHKMSPFSIDPDQRFSPPPARYTEASLIKVLESEGIGRPSTYASITQTIQDRKYVELIDRRFYASDLGMVVTDKLIEAFPNIMQLGYTRNMETELDKIEEEHHNWVTVLEEFYTPFVKQLAIAEENLKHAKAEILPAPKEYRCAKCDSDLVYRFGKNGRFLSCSTYPECEYACPVDREGKPRPAEYVNIRCPKTGRPMIRKTGRFGPFVTTLLEEGEPQDFGLILNIDKKGFVKAPSPPAVLTELPCKNCDRPLNLRKGFRGPWLGCSGFPKCKGRGKWTELDEKIKETLQAELDKCLAANPVDIIYMLDGRALTDNEGKPLPEAPKVDELLIDDPKVFEKSMSGAA
jgi:DNA topoisomerase-1